MNKEKYVPGKKLLKDLGFKKPTKKQCESPNEFLINNKGIITIFYRESKARFELALGFEYFNIQSDAELKTFIKVIGGEK